MSRPARAGALWIVIGVWGCATTSATAPEPPPRDPWHVDANKADARTYGDACDDGNGYACAQLALVQARKRTRSGDRHARRLLDRGCELDSPRSCFAAAQSRRYGWLGHDEDEDGAARLYIQACELDARMGCTEGGYWLENRGEDKRAVELYRRGCDAGRPQSCHNLGVAYAVGVGGAPDIEHAVVLYEHACKLGAAGACSDLGWRVRDGVGAERDLARAEALLRRSCELGGVGGCDMLASLLRDTGRGAEASRYWTKACHAGRATACRDQGDKVKERGGDPTPWFQRFRKLVTGQCEEGDGHACYSLAYAAYQGRGVARDRELALRMGKKACGLKWLAACHDVARWLAEDPRYDRNERVALLLPTCLAERPDACHQLARLETVGILGPPDLRAATRYAELGCEHVHYGSCFWLRELAPSSPLVHVAIDQLTSRCDEDAYQCGLAAILLLKSPQPERELQRAERLAQRACGADDVFGCYVLAIARSEQGRSDEGWATLREAYELSPERTVDYVSDRGVGLEFKRRWMTRLCAEGDARLCNQAAWDAVEDERFEDAERLARRALKLDPGLPPRTAMDTLACALIARGDPDEALFLLEQAQARTPDQPVLELRRLQALAAKRGESTTSVCAVTRGAEDK